MIVTVHCTALTESISSHPNRLGNVNFNGSGSTSQFEAIRNASAKLERYCDRFQTLPDSQALRTVIRTGISRWPTAMIVRIPTPLLILREEEREEDREESEERRKTSEAAMVDGDEL